jgi:hypothetical protein|eukprot:COSAG01_NODE_4788_length_4743_cov_45.744832_3_plen_89_part_00
MARCRTDGSVDSRLQPGAVTEESQLSHQLLLTSVLCIVEVLGGRVTLAVTVRQQMRSFLLHVVRHAPVAPTAVLLRRSGWYMAGTARH